MAWDRDWTIPLLTADFEDLAAQLYTPRLQAPQQRLTIVPPV